MNGLRDQTENGFVKNLNESAKRLVSVKIVKKDAISSEMLIELCDMFSEIQICLFSKINQWL